MPDKFDEQPLYMIGVVAKLTGMHPQTLRLYERRKLCLPQRSEGSTRLYSRRDIERLKLIYRLTHEEGINLAGVRRALDLLEEVESLQEAVVKMKEEFEDLRRQMDEEIEKVHRSYRRELVLMPRRQIAKRS